MNWKWSITVKATFLKHLQNKLQAELRLGWRGSLHHTCSIYWLYQE